MPKVTGPTRVEKFQVDYGEVFHCEQIIVGTDRLQQTIRVKGCGEKADPATYGAGGHPVEDMAGTARIIAFDLIGSA